jgi:hypothetical protein
MAEKISKNERDTLNGTVKGFQNSRERALGGLQRK